MERAGNSGRDLSTANAALLLLVAPIVLRLWLEAVVWRLASGPQMLGFSLAHGGAGWLTILLFLSFLAIYLYALWVVAVILLWLIPASRRRIAKAQLVALGGATLALFLVIAEALQQDIAMWYVLVGAGAMTLLVCLLGWLIYSGLIPSRREPANGAV